MTKGGIYGCMLTAARWAAAPACAREEARSIPEIGHTARWLVPAAFVLLPARSTLVERLVSVRQRR